MSWGTSVHMYDSDGNKVWEIELDIYGNTRSETEKGLTLCLGSFRGCIMIRKRSFAMLDTGFTTQVRVLSSHKTR